MSFNNEYCSYFVVYNGRFEFILICTFEKSEKNEIHIKKKDIKLKSNFTLYI